MKNLVSEIDRVGYSIVDNILSSSESDDIERMLTAVATPTAGTRALLKQEWCAALAERLKLQPEILTVMPDKAAAVQCTLFDKNDDRNWLVALHRDEFIPVKKKFDSVGWDAWSVKQGTHFVRPPRTVLEQLLSVRIAIDANDDQNGPLEVVPGSHNQSNANAERISCLVARGSALVMRPLVLHSSKKVHSGRRRVLHFLFGPASLPDGAEWAYSI